MAPSNKFFPQDLFFKHIWVDKLKKNYTFFGVRHFFLVFFQK